MKEFPPVKFTAAEQAYSLIGLFVASLFLYLYFLNVSVVHVVMRKEASQEANQLRAEIATLETTYISAQHTIADRMATLEGYNTDVEKIFVTRGAGGLVLGQN